MTLKIGISGNRIICDAEREKIAAEIERSICNILKRNNTNQFIGYTPLAIGADTIFAEVVTKVFNMPLQIILPLPLSEYENDFSEEEKKCLNLFIEQYPKYEISNNLIPRDNFARNESYLKVGMQIVDTCEEMIFVWDENKPSGRGGTAEVISYFYEKKNKKPSEYIVIKEQKEDLLDSAINEEFMQSNLIATEQRDSYKLVWKFAIFFGWLAVVFFAINTAFYSKLKPEISIIFSCLEFVFVFSVFIIIMRAKATDLHGKYINKRLRAEKLRVIRYFYHANVEIKVSELTSTKDNTLYNFVNNVNKQIKESKYSSKLYANYSIKMLILEQMKYHSDRIKQSGNKFHWFEKVNLVIAIFFMINLVVHVINSFLHYLYESHIELYSHEVIIILNILLPASYAAIEGVLYFQEWAVLKKYSVSATESFKDILEVLPKEIEQLDDKTCFSRQAIALNLASSIMLTDNKNWNLIFENKNNYHMVI